MPDPAPEQLRELLALQDTDSAIRRLEHQLASLVEQQQLDACQAHLAQLVAERDETIITLERDRGEQRQLEREIDVLTQRRDAESARLYDGTVTNAREMRSVEAEIETTKRRITEHEELLIEVLERVEGLEAHQAELAERIAVAQERAGELTAARDAAAKTILAETAELKAVRERQAATVPKDLLDRYDKVVARTGGVAIGELNGQSCSACRVEMSMADVGELLAGPSLTTCPQCRRLLVVA